MTGRGTPQTTDLLIVGAGPAGLSTALHLVRTDRRWAERLLVLDRAIHPRDKLCGGGLTRSGEAVLDELGLGPLPPSVPITEMRLVFGDRGWAVRDDPVFRVVRRSELDHWLLRCAEREGIEVRQGERVEDLLLTVDGVEVATDRGLYRAQAVVGADGSNGAVRRRLGWSAGAHRAGLLEVLTPEAPDTVQDGLPWRGVAVFDFTPMRDGVRGYYWDFPSLVEGRPMMNRGIFDSRVGGSGPSRPLKALLEEGLSRRGRSLDEAQLKGHPIRWFDPTARCSGERVVLAGDAAGVDPLFGEGISFSLRHGRVAAAAVADAFARGDLSFTDYRRRQLDDPLLAHLPRRKRLAEAVYRLRGALGWGPLWALVPWATQALERLRPGILPIEDTRLERLRLPPTELRSGA